VKPTEILREAIFPLTSLTVLMAVLVFGALLWLGSAAGLFGLWLMFIVIPAVFRYAIYLLEARAHGAQTHVAGIEIFNIADNLWGLFPLLLIVGFGWLEWRVLQSFGPRPALFALGLFFLVYPASMAVLAVTRSPTASVNPVALGRLVRRCGLRYLAIPGVLSVVGAVIYAVVLPVAPGFVVYFVAVFLFFLMFTLTGKVVYASDVAAEVGIEAPAVPSEAEAALGRVADRQKVANHAYGFISRGNREGGFQHVREWIAGEADADDAVSWFFNEMMRWENKDAALRFGQECFAHFLHHERDAMALKVVSRCQHEDPAWRPRREDRPAAIDLAERYGREDLLPGLRR
jgi:hypothetical protein